MATTPGFEVMHPYSQLLIDGEKSVETRDFPLPEHYTRVPVVLVQSGGPHSAPDALVALGRIRFTGCFEYVDRLHWEADYRKHCVEPDHGMFGFNEGEPKYGWNVEVVERWPEAVNVGDHVKTEYQSFLELPRSFASHMNSG